MSVSFGKPSLSDEERETLEELYQFSPVEFRNWFVQTPLAKRNLMVGCLVWMLRMEDLEWISSQDGVDVLACTVGQKPDWFFMSELYGRFDLLDWWKHHPKVKQAQCFDNLLQQMVEGRVAHVAHFEDSSASPLYSVLECACRHTDPTTVFGWMWELTEHHEAFRQEAIGFFWGKCWNKLPVPIQQLATPQLLTHVRAREVPYIKALLDKEELLEHASSPSPTSPRMM